jgi:hypothetical protein
MSLSRYAKKRDANEAGIVRALRKAGAKVWLLDRPVDLLVFYMGLFTVLEVKTKKGKLTKDQELMVQQTGLLIVRDEIEALRAVGVL